MKFYNEEFQKTERSIKRTFRRVLIFNLALAAIGFLGVGLTVFFLMKQFGIVG